MVEIDMTAPTVAPVVRDRAMYRTRGGAEVQVSYNQSGADNPFYSNAPKQWYFPNGSVNRNRAPHVNDLIAIIPAPDSVEPDATQETGVVVDIVCETVRVLHRGGVVFVEIAKDLDGGDAGIATVHDGTSVVEMTPAAAVAIARAILRMAGESK